MSAAELNVNDNANGVAPVRRSSRGAGGYVARGGGGASSALCMSAASTGTAANVSGVAGWER